MSCGATASTHQDILVLQGVLGSWCVVCSRHRRGVCSRGLMACGAWDAARNAEASSRSPAPGNRQTWGRAACHRPSAVVGPAGGFHWLTCHPAANSNPGSSGMLAWPTCALAAALVRAGRRVHLQLGPGFDWKAVRTRLQAAGPSARRRYGQPAAACRSRPVAAAGRVQAGGLWSICSLQLVFSLQLPVWTALSA